MQTLDIISVNLWQTLISLTNLVILFLAVKRFLFKPVNNVLAQRQKEIDEQYASAEYAEQKARYPYEEFDRAYAKLPSLEEAIATYIRKNAQSF